MNNTDPRSAPVGPSSSIASVADRVPPHLFFMVSAVFHYLGPSFAVLLFQHVGVLGVAWLRIASAALVFAVWRRPWRVLIEGDRRPRWLVIGLGAALAVMNACFYLAISRLPLATVAAIEFLATIAVALAGVRSARNLLALAAAMGGVYLLIGPDWSSPGVTDWIGLGFAVLNAAFFALYIVLGHAISRAPGAASGVDRLGAAMLVALVFAVPIGFGDALPALASPLLLLAGIGVGLSSSVVPYVCDQLAMARLPRATFALLLALLPATAAVVGALVLQQVPTSVELIGIALVGVGVGLHKPPT
jgi:inner membrane transporter RhtA